MKQNFCFVGMMNLKNKENMKKNDIKKSPLKVKILIFCAVFIVIVFFGLVVARKILNKNTLDSTFYTVRKEIYENCIEIAGTVSAAEEQTLQALSDGTVTEVYVKAGDKVKKGDVLIQLDDTTEQYNLAKHDYDMQVTRANGSAKEYKLMQTERLSLVQKISDRQIVATFDGFIADLDVSVNDSLEAKDSVGTIVNVDYLTADVEVSETDVSKLKVGQKVEFTFPAYTEKKVYGYVVSWPAIGEVTSRGATIVKAKVRIDEYPKEILPNFSFTGKIQITEPQENLVVERCAVAYEDGSAYVEIAKVNKKILVKVIPYGSEYVKILEGLDGGEILKAQSVAKQSGWNRRAGPGGNSGAKANRTGGGGAGGPPPGRF